MIRLLQGVCVMALLNLVCGGRAAWAHMFPRINAASPADAQAEQKNPVSSPAELQCGGAGADIAVSGDGGAGGEERIDWERRRTVRGEDGSGGTPQVSHILHDAPHREQPRQGPHAHRQVDGQVHGEPRQRAQPVVPEFEFIYGFPFHEEGLRGLCRAGADQSGLQLLSGKLYRHLSFREGHPALPPGGSDPQRDGAVAPGRQGAYEEAEGHRIPVEQLPAGFLIQLPDVPSVHQDFPLIRLIQPAQQLDYSGLAAAVHRPRKSP